MVVVWLTFRDLVDACCVDRQYRLDAATYKKISNPPLFGSIFQKRPTRDYFLPPSCRSKSPSLFIGSWKLDATSLPSINARTTTDQTDAATTCQLTVLHTSVQVGTTTWHDGGGSGGGWGGWTLSLSQVKRVARYEGGFVREDGGEKLQITE
jgi:hypothetical protein